MRHLEVDGVTHSVHPEGNTEYKSDLFVNVLNRGSGRSVTLLNYPRPQEQYSYIKWDGSVYKLHSKQQRQVETKHLSEELDNHMFRFASQSLTNMGENNSEKTIVALAALLERFWVPICLCVQSPPKKIGMESSI